MVQAIESGAAGSVDAYVRLATALGLRLEIGLSDPAVRASALSRRSVDSVHSAMGELEAAHLRRLAYSVAIDEPYQHYQFAGRADVAAWDLERRAFLHLENRTRVPDIQDAAGSYNAKKAYLAESIGQRLQVSSWASQTHAIVGLWSAEFLHAVRMRPESFRSICPDSADAFAGWWRGEVPISGQTSALVVIDPIAAPNERQWIAFETALTARPRHRGYAEVAAAIPR